MRLSDFSFYKDLICYPKRMLRKNPVIRLTNYFLFGILGGGLLAWMLSSLDKEDVQIPPTISRSETVESQRKQGGVMSAEALNSTSSDTDGDGIPNTWELSHSLDPNDPTDASSDFDFDGLTALQEFQHGTSPLGVWVEEGLDLGGVLKAGSRQYLKFTASGYILVSGTLKDTSSGSGRSGILWHRDTGPVEIAKPSGSSLYLWDVNEYGEVVGGYIPPGGGLQRAFRWSAKDGFQEIAPPSSMTGIVLGYRINDLGDVLLQSVSSAPIVSAVVSENGETITELASDLDQPRLLCLNNYREMLGVYLSPADGTPKAFLRLPGLSDFDTSLASSYPNLFDEDTAVSLFTAQMNDFGEFGCDYEVEGPAWNPIIDSYFFDGDFHSFRQADDKRVQLLGLNNRPQLLFSVRTSVGGSYNLSSSYRFSSGGQIAPVSSFHDNSASTQPPNYSKINDNGVILGYRGYSRHPFLLRLDQDADADGLSDDWETYYGFNPNSALDANQDEDGDGYTNLAEFRLKRNPTVVEVPSATTGQVPDLRPGIDTDGDGMPNVWEVHHGLNWEDPADAAYDPDRDGFTNLEEFKLGTDPQGAPAFQVLSLPDHYQNAGGSLSLMADDETGYFGTFVAGPSESEVFQWTPQDLTPGSVKPESLTLHSTTQYGEWPASLSAHASGVFGGSLRRSSTSHVSIPAYWDAQGVHRFDSFGLTSGSIQAISNDGRFVCGTRQINSIHQIFVHDRQLGTTRPVSLGNLRALGWGNFTIHPSGYLLAPVRNVGHASESAIFKKTTSGTWVLDTYLPGSISTQTYMSQKSDVTVAGTMRPSGTKAHLFTWSPSQGYRNVGRPDGGSEAYVRAMSPSGIFAGHTRVLDQSTGELVNRAFLSRFNTDSGDVTFDFLATPAGLSSEVRSLNDQGEVLGFVKDGYTSTDGIWRGLSSFYALDDIIKSPEKEIFHTYVSKINERGEILARGIVDDVYTSFVLQPVTDTDADGIPDRYENSFGFDPFSQDDGILDFDGDGLSNRDEFKHNTDPVLPDTDADGMPDSWEVEWGLDARDPSNANQDPDRDRVSNLREYEIGTVPTGLYQMSHLELPALPSQSATLVSKVPDQDSYLINLNASDLPRRPVIVSSGSAGGPPTLTHFQPLTVGKQASAIKLTENGFIIGYSYTPNHRRRIVLWETDYPNQKPRPLLYGVGDGYQSIIDISENGYWILARWQKFDGSYTVGVLNNSEPWDGVTISSDYNDFGDQLAAGESINWTRINDRGEVLGIRSGPGSQANEDSFNIVTRASSDAFGAASGIVNLLQTPITAPSESWPWMQINGNVNDRSYAVSLEEYPSYSGLGKDSRTHFVVHDLGEYGNFVPSPTANLLDLPDSPSFRVIDTNRAGDLLAQQFSYGYLNRGQGMIRIDALRIDDPSTASAASVSALPTLHELLGTSDCRPQFVDEQGLIAGLIVNSDRSVRIWSMIEVADQDENGLNDDWQKAYQDWTGNNSPVNGLSLDSQTGMMLAQLSSTSHPSGGEIIQSGNWVGKVLERTLDEIFEALAPRLVGQKIFHSFTSVVRSDSSVDSWHTGFILGNVADPNRFWGHKTTNPPIASLHKNLVDHPYVYDENGNILSSDRLRFSPRNGLPYNHQFLDSRFFNSRGVGVNGDSRTIFLEKSALQYQLPIKSLEKQQYSALLLVYKRKKGEEDIFLDESRLIEFTVEKDARKSEVVEILPDLKNLKEDSNAKYALIYDLLPMEIVPDYNRDGKITGADRGQISEENPFRWWINNDNDVTSEEVKKHGYDIPDPPTLPPAFENHHDFAINGMRDLVDFFPLHLDLKGVLGALPSDEYSYFLKHADGALKFYEETETILHAHHDSHGPAAYLRNLTKARAVKSKALKHAISGGVQLSEEILEAFKGGKGVLICEATKKTDKPLFLEIRKSDGTSIAEIKFPVKFSGVEDMYRHGNMRNTTGGKGGLRTQLQDPGDPYPDELTNGKYFVFLHGFKVGPDAARGWHAEIFKRLHQMGSRNRFIGISWHGDVAPDYHEAVKNAFLTSKALPAWLQVGGADIVIAAHSLGNMVVSNAIEHEDHNGVPFTPTAYFMINAATPIEAYDASQTTGADGTDMAPRMTENVWKPYDCTLYAANWHRLFDAPDGREKLKWPNRFANRVPQLAYNFYSTGEDVVENADEGESFIGNAGTHLFNFFVRHAWVQNEIMKGHPLASLITKDTHAGWAFNDHPVDGYTSPSMFQPNLRVTMRPSDSESLTPDQLRAKPFHEPFKFVALYDNARGSAEANKKQVQFELLAAAIPAMSYAAAANPVNGLTLAKGGKDSNFNMMNQRNGGWPRDTGHWQHSDFRDVAFSYVVPMFQKMINQGKLDE